MSRKLPVAKRDDPIRAYKIGFIQLSRNRVRLISAGTQTETTPEMQMRCGAGQLHNRPDPQCTCGFYAYRDLVTLHRRQMTPSSPVLMEVDLSGEVREARRTWRAEHQRVICLYFPRQCTTPGCAQDPAGVAQRGELFAPTCEACWWGSGAGHATFYTLAEISALVGIETRWNGRKTGPLTHLPGHRYLIPIGGVLGGIWLQTFGPEVVPVWGRELIGPPLGFATTLVASQVLYDRFGNARRKVRWVL